MKQTVTITSVVRLRNTGFGNPRFRVNVRNAEGFVSSLTTPKDSHYTIQIQNVIGNDGQRLVGRQVRITTNPGGELVAVEEA